MMTDPLVIPVFIPFYGCPNKCFFCNQNAVTGINSPVMPEKNQLLEYFTEFMSYTKFLDRPVEVAFFGGNFLGMDNDIILKYLKIAQIFCNQGKKRGIRFSTRPDTITTEKLELISEFSIKTIELGIQSMDDMVLRKSGRGHSSKDSLNAVNLIKKIYPDVNLGLQIMPGLPGEQRASILKVLKFLKYANPRYLRIYPLVILKNTQLEKLYLKGIFKPLELEEAIDISSLIRDYCKKNKIRVIRMGLPSQAAEQDNIIAGPWHPSFGELVISRSFYKKLLVRIVLTDNDTAFKKLEIIINPSFESAARGIKNSNIEKLKKRFGFEKIIIQKNSKIDFESFYIKIT
jgi:histone acetyltransferase (RNA polymerase elongator complex component)